MSSSYNIFSSYYDDLTFNVDYNKRFEYISEIMTRLDRDFGSSLDLACGTGTLTLLMKKNGIDVIGADMSVDMLSVASMKAYDEGYQILFINQKMQELELPYKVDTVVSSLDAVNHMIELDDVKETFLRVSEFLSDNGVFVFDLNTVYKHEKVLADNTFTYDIDDVYLTWKNTLLDDHIVRIDLDFDDREGHHYYEQFSERAYESEDIINMLRDAGFKSFDVYDDLTFDRPGWKSEKITVVAKKY